MKDNKKMSLQELYDKFNPGDFKLKTSSKLLKAYADQNSELMFSVFKEIVEMEKILVENPKLPVENPKFIPGYVSTATIGSNIHKEFMDKDVISDTPILDQLVKELGLVDECDIDPRRTMENFWIVRSALRSAYQALKSKKDGTKTGN
ncbi:MAG: hypothetical protein KA270_08830 [Saprospiraceae bacterium]|nr:hypothetical protein [Saprospiraceae bacterium]MBP6567256.1 hypothetical protein [Saprospiraceae bacterium]